MLAFGSVWFISKKNGPSGYGLVAAVLAGSQFLQIFVNWSCLALARFGMEEFVQNGKIEKTFWSRTVLFLPNLFFVLALSFLWLPLLGDFLKLPSGLNLLLMLLFVVQSVWMHVQHALQGAKLMTYQSFLLALERLIIFFLLIFFEFSGKRLNEYTAVSAFAAAPFFVSIIGIFRIYRLIGLKRYQFNKKFLKKILVFSLPVIPFTFVGFFATGYLDAFFIIRYLSVRDWGIYSLAYQFMGIFMQLPVLANTLLLSLFVTLKTKGEEGKIVLYMEKILPLITLLWSSVCVFLTLAGVYFIKIFWNENFEQSANLLFVLSLSPVVNLPVLLGYAPYINTLGVTYISAFLNLTLAAVNVILNFLLIPQFGLTGSAWATNLAYFCSVITAHVFVFRKYSLPRFFSLNFTLPYFLGVVVFSLTKNILLSGFIILFLNYWVFRYLKMNSNDLLINIKSLQSYFR
ncbi:MAG: polysaccharide biosynthesis C-terminal domain-containing protein [Chitinophagaceae bacterium]|nr:polysaccharide biosynthesis C-terminal domain-containing protein [Chitinophagaceae bacterium]